MFLLHEGFCIFQAQFFANIHYKILKSKGTEKNLSPLVVEAQCWSKNLANFMQILPESIKCPNYITHRLIYSFEFYFYKEKKKSFFSVCSWNIETVSFNILRSDYDCFFFNRESLHAIPNIHYEAWSYKKKKEKMIKAYKKSVYKYPRVKRCLLILDLKPFRS